MSVAKSAIIIPLKIAFLQKISVIKLFTLLGVITVQVVDKWASGQLNGKLKYLLHYVYNNREYNPKLKIFCYFCLPVCFK